jgi:hypothetical protein
MAVTIDTVIELTDAVVKTKYENNANTNAFTDALLAKLNGIEASATADQTGAEIVTLIDTELGGTGWQASGGEANDLVDVGAGTGLDGGKSGVNLQLKSLVAGTGISLSSTATEVTITATGGGGGVTRSVDTPAAIGVTSIKAVRLGGTAVTFGGSAATGFTLDIPADTEITQLDVTATNDTGTNASGELVLAVDNSANSYDRLFMYEIYDLTNDQKVDQHLTGLVMTQAVAANVTTLTIPNVQGGFPNGYRLILR